MTTFIDVIPVLVYDDIAAGHDFLVDVLGFESAGLYRDGDGVVIHGEVRAGDRRFWLHRVAEDHGLATPEALGRTVGGTVVHVTDVDDHFRRAQAKGATILREPTDEDYGQREYGLRDPGGHQWYVATPVGAPAT